MCINQVVLVTWAEYPTRLVSAPSAFNNEVTQPSLLAIPAKGVDGGDVCGTNGSRPVLTAIPAKVVGSDFLQEHVDLMSRMRCAVGLNQVSVTYAFNIESTQPSLLAIPTKGADGGDSRGTNGSRPVSTTIAVKGVEIDSMQEHIDLMGRRMR
jgi:hypothetical protein